MKVALFGGSFDPVHRGHVAIARAAADAFALQRVLFAPTGRQPLKPEGASATFAQRLAMVELACGEDARFRPSELDGPRGDGRPNYTVDALETLRETLPGAEMFLLTGADSVLEMRRWHRWERVLELARWIAVSRPGWNLEELAGLDLTESQRRRIHVLESVHEGVSATELRRRLAAGETCEDLLPDGVAQYIRERSLYRTR